MKLIYTDEFKADIKKIKDKKIQTRIKKIIRKIISDPDIGKILKYELFPLRTYIQEVMIHPSDFYKRTAYLVSSHK